MPKFFRHIILSSSLFFLATTYTFALAPSSPVVAHQGMVVSEQQLASQIGRSILQQGGNAIDAAVAVGYALAVVLPCCGNIGGGGFMLIHLASGQNIFINFRERAPLAATSKMYLDPAGNLIANKSMDGYLAVAVPGTVLGLDTALKKYGTMTRQQVMAPAIKLAKAGVIIGSSNAHDMAKKFTSFSKQKNVAAIFLHNNALIKPNEVLKQPQLANTLKQIADNGPDYFYKGPIATKIAAASYNNGGILTEKDFANYSVEELPSITCNYRGYTIISAPPPSSGGVTLCEMLGILAHYPLSSLGYHSAQSIHYMVEAMRIAFRDRNNQLGDPDFVYNPTTHLLSPEYIERMQKQIQATHATPSGGPRGARLLPESTQTTHYSIVDSFGNAVAVTYTLNSYYGAKVIAGDTGFFLNNTMDDFAVKSGTPNQFGLVQGKANAIAGGKRALSSMTPTIVMKDGKVVMVLGSPGGPRIITSVLQTIVNVIDYGMNIQEAINAPRFHHQWLPDVIDYEPNAILPETRAKLMQMGYQFYPRAPWSAVEAIYIDSNSPNNQNQRILYGANDRRRPAGKAMGY